MGVLKKKKKKRKIVRFKELGNCLTNHRFADESTVEVIVKFYMQVTICAWIAVVPKVLKIRPKKFLKMLNCFCQDSLIFCKQRHLDVDIAISSKVPMF